MKEKGFSTHDARGLQYFAADSVDCSFRFSTHDARGLQCGIGTSWALAGRSFSTHDARGLQYFIWVHRYVFWFCFSTHDARGLQLLNHIEDVFPPRSFQYPRCTWVVVVQFRSIHKISGGFSTHDARGLQSAGYKARSPLNVLVPTMHVGCSSEICTKAVSLCSYFITMCCICQVLFPINFRFFILFFCSICFYSDFLVRIPLFHPLNRRENQEFRGTIFYYYLLKCNYF